MPKGVPVHIALHTAADVEAPGPWTNVVAFQVSDGSITVEGDHPTMDQSGGPLTGYTGGKIWTGRFIDGVDPSLGLSYEQIDEMISSWPNSTTVPFAAGTGRASVQIPSMGYDVDQWIAIGTKDD